MKDYIMLFEQFEEENFDRDSVSDEPVDGPTDMEVLQQEEDDLESDNDLQAKIMAGERDRANSPVSRMHRMSQKLGHLSGSAPTLDDVRELLADMKSDMSDEELKPKLTKFIYSGGLEPALRSTDWQIGRALISDILSAIKSRPELGEWLAARRKNPQYQTA